MRKILLLRKEWKEGLHSKGNKVMNAKGGGRGGGGRSKSVNANDSCSFCLSRKVSCQEQKLVLLVMHRELQKW